MIMEILSPAGKPECLTAAIRSGADAVYFGTQVLNARRNADNFTYDEMAQAVKQLRSVGAKAHITLNTLMSDDEIPSAIDCLKHICSVDADVLILQDLGLVTLARHCAPDLLRHASTQMSVQTSYGIRLLEKMGFTRAVLPREISLEEIKYIRSKTKIQLEAFVHGAMCMCISGQCYLSAMLGSRSGNRGLCAQPCRLAFSAENGTGHDLSLKDMSLIDEIHALQNAGVCSVKIEGRMKRPEYVAAAVTACKNALNNTPDKQITASLHSVFSRDGFSKGYFQGKLGTDMFGIRQKEDVVAAKDVLPMLQRLYDREVGRVEVDFYLTVFQGEKVSLTASSGTKKMYVEIDCIPEKAINKPLTKENLSDRLSKCGGTIFIPRKIEIDLDDNLSVPASVINALRRDALDGLLSKLSETSPKKFVPVKVNITPHTATERKLFARFDNMSHIPDNLDGIETVYVPMFSDSDRILELMKRVKVGVEIPTGIFGTEKIVFDRLSYLKKIGVKLAFCGNLDGVAIARELKMEIHTSFSLNIFNTLSLNVIEKLGSQCVTLSPELTLKQIKNLGGKVQRGVFAYGRLPLMVTRNCPVKNGKACDECKRSSCLTDRMNTKFPVRCSNNCSYILNSRPVYMGDRLNEIENADFLLLYFTVENKKEIENVLHAYKNELPPTLKEFTRGLLYRGVE